MKPKALNKRLVLKRETIAHLGKTAMGEVYGGFFETLRTVCTPTCKTDCPLSCGPLSECICPIEPTARGC